MQELDYPLILFNYNINFIQMHSLSTSLKVKNSEHRQVNSCPHSSMHKNVATLSFLVQNPHGLIATLVLFVHFHDIALFAQTTGIDLPLPYTCEALHTPT